jgi:endoglucanase
MRYLILFFLMLNACNVTKKTEPINQNNTYKASAVALHGKLSIIDTHIINEKGEVVSFAGNSLFWSNDYYKGHSFYTKEVLAWLQKDWKSNIIRIPVAADPDIHDSYIYNPIPNQEKLYTIVDAALELGLYVIIDWHTQKAELNEKEAIRFFEEVARKYGHYPNIIYEIYNEPLKISWDDVIKPYAENVIAAIREIDPDNIIVVGTPHWSQDVDKVALNPIKGYQILPIRYTFTQVHITNGYWTKRKKPLI